MNDSTSGPLRTAPLPSDPTLQGHSPGQVDGPLRLALPRGRMANAVRELLADADAAARAMERGLRPELGLPGFAVKELKPRDVVRLLASGTRELGFVGADRVAEAGLELPLLLDTGLDPVRLALAAPKALLGSRGRLPRGRLRVATEYPRLVSAWGKAQGLAFEIVETHGATEVFPPEDADLIADVVQSGATLRANGLVEVATLMESTTRLFASKGLMEEVSRRERAERFALLLRAVLEARGRVLLELNVSWDDLERVVEVLPAMKRPTVSPLLGEVGCAVRAAVPRSALAELLPELIRRGGSDLLVSRLERVLP